MTSYGNSTSARTSSKACHATPDSTSLQLDPMDMSVAWKRTNEDSSIQLLKQLVHCFVLQRSPNRCHINTKNEEERLHQHLKKLTYHTLLSHRKEVNNNDIGRLNEVEELLWKTYELRCQRRFDEAWQLEKNLKWLRKAGCLEESSDVRCVLQFLVALSEEGGTRKQTTTAYIRPRTLFDASEDSNYKVNGPLNYGETFIHTLSSGHHYTQYPPEVFQLPSIFVMSAAQGNTRNSTNEDEQRWKNLCGALPGTGLSTMFLPGNIHSDIHGRALGAMTQSKSRPISPELELTIPELPDDFRGYKRVIRVPKAVVQSPETVGSDEDNVSSGNSVHWPPVDEKEEVDWEKIAQMPPLPNRYTWENRGHRAVEKEKPFLSEAGPETVLRLWTVFNELWSCFDPKLPEPRYRVKGHAELCRDVLLLLVGIPSSSFEINQETKKFEMVPGLCITGISPEPLQSLLKPMLHCGSLVRRLEAFSKLGDTTWQIIHQGLVQQAFRVAVCKFMQFYRGSVLALGNEKNILRLNFRTQHLIKLVHHVARVCHLNGDTYDIEDVEKDVVKGLALVGELYEQAIEVMDKECSKVHVSLLKTTCQPFFRYIETWIFEGTCDDPGLEYMISVNEKALLSRDRSYWTQGYILKDLNSIPHIFHALLKDVFMCGKTLNLLKLCSPKHHLVKDCIKQKHLNIDFGDSMQALAKVVRECEVYEAQMEYLSAEKEVSVWQLHMQQQQQESSQILKISSSSREDHLKEIEKNIRELRQQEAAKKRQQLAVIREQMMEAEEKRQEMKKLEKEKDKREEELQRLENERIKQELQLRNQMELYYSDLMKEAEKRVLKAKWKVKRHQLREARIQFHQQADVWPQEQLVNSDGRDYRIQNVEIVIKDDSKGKRNHNIETPSESDKEMGTLYTPTSMSGSREISPCTETPMDEMSCSQMSTSSDIAFTPQEEDPRPMEELTGDISQVTLSTNNMNLNTFITAHNEAYKSSVQNALYKGELKTDCETSKNLLQGSTINMNNFNDATAITAVNDNSFIKGTKGVLGAEARSIRSKVINEEYVKSDEGLQPRHRGLVGTAAAEIRRKVLEEEYGIGLDTGSVGVDDNANVSTDFTSVNPKIPRKDLLLDEDENANTDNEDAHSPRSFPAASAAKVNAMPDLGGKATGVIVCVSKTAVSDPNGNESNISRETEDRNSSQRGFTVSKLEDTSTSRNEPNQSTRCPRSLMQETRGSQAKEQLSEHEAIVAEFKETRAMAAANKRKVKELEFNSLPGAKSWRTPVVNNIEEGRNEQEIELCTSSVGSSSCYSAYSHQTSGFSNFSDSVFNTPDTEKPILIDQIGGEILRARGRNIHGHVSDSVIHKFFQDETHGQERNMDVKVKNDLLDARRLTIASKVQPYTKNYHKIIKGPQLIDITGTALHGKPHTRNMSDMKVETPTDDATSEKVTCLPVFFIKAIWLPVAAQMKLVNKSVLNHILVEKQLIEHFKALRAYCLMVNGEFAQVLTHKLFTKFASSSNPAHALNPCVLNSILNKSLDESSNGPISPLADNLSFVVTNIPKVFNCQSASSFECVELQYRVNWPHNLIIDDQVQATYSRVWRFLVSFRYTMWASMDIYKHLTTLYRQSKASHNLSSNVQFHHISLYRHEIQHYIHNLFECITNQILFGSWAEFMRKLEQDISSIDELYELHKNYLNGVVAGCFLTTGGSVMLKLLEDLFGHVLKFRSQLLSQPWRITQSPNGSVVSHPAFEALTATYNDFKNSSMFIHKLLSKFSSMKYSKCTEDLLMRLDYNEFYSGSRVTRIPSVLKNAYGSQLLGDSQ
ncbi:gamma-tubulin complex component 6-like isoform X2 [Oratosquilla oratoria]|uniref:gamma-tubulin complex component 6-like isoform X2 n=1 Tax=Oratosquilla oratoria TaxID=337810 RepID=UPI003F76B278